MKVCEIRISRFTLFIFQTIEVICPSFSTCLNVKMNVENAGTHIVLKAFFLQHRNSLPEHVFPSPVKPALHAHAYDPAVLLHTALTSQL